MFEHQEGPAEGQRLQSYRKRKPRKSQCGKWREGERNNIDVPLFIQRVSSYRC